MQIYLAPMEGLTGYVVRNAFHHHFDFYDKYFTPFISYAENMNFKQLRDVKPENNEGLHLVVQLMSNKSSEVLHQAAQQAVFGHHELNINLGCPSGTVASKGRGSGFLQYPDEIDSFLQGVYAQAHSDGLDFTMSVKTRVGYQDTANWEKLMQVYRKYPEMGELIIHPRIQKDAYKGAVRLEAFDRAVEVFADSGIDLVYNGDIFDMEAFQRIHERYPSVDRFMLGRGAFIDPALPLKMKGGSMPEEEYRRRLGAYLDEIVEEYLKIFSGPKDVIYHMKEHWLYLTQNFQDSEKHWKRMKKCHDMDDYRSIVNSYLRDLELVK